MRRARACSAAAGPARSTLGGDEGVAVAVAADPAAHAQEGRQLGAVPGRVAVGELVLEGGVEARQLAQEGVVVIREAVRHLVDHLEPGAAQDAGLPEGQDRRGARPPRSPPPPPGVRRMRSRSARSCATSISRSMVQRRRTSVGCAVSTGDDQRRAEEGRELGPGEPGLRGRGRAPRPWCPRAAPSRRGHGRGSGACGAGPRRCWRGARSS